jgi:hypothetical protein
MVGFSGDKLRCLWVVNIFSIIAPLELFASNQFKKNFDVDDGFDLKDRLKYT